MVHLDVTMDDGGVDVDVHGVGYTDQQVINALDGETVTPGQVGTESDPVDESHVQSQHSRELSVSGWSAGKALNQDNFSNFTEHIGYQVSVSGSSDHEMFSVSEPVDVIVGTVVGNVTRDLTVTWDDGTSDNFYNGTARGRDSDGDGISFNPIPPLEDVTALAFRNASGSSDVYGYKVITV